MSQMSNVSTVNVSGREEIGMDKLNLRNQRIQSLDKGKTH